MRRISAHYIFPIAQPPLRNAVVTLSDEGEILDVSASRGNVQEEEGVEFYNGIIAPAFVNAHCHLELSYMRGKIACGTGLAEFVQQTGIQKRLTNTEQTQVAAQFADAHLYSSGVAAVGDIANGSECFALKQNSRILYHTFVEKFGLLSSQNQTIIQQAQQLRQLAHGMGLSASVTPHAPYSVLPDLLQSLSILAQQQGILSIHHQESKDEQQLFAHGSGALASQFSAMGLTLPPANGQHSLQYLSQYVSRDLQMLLVHNLYTTCEHYDFTVRHWDKIFWILCPLSNLYIENTFPPVEMLRQKGAAIALGTDSFASHPSLLLIDDLIALHKHFPHIALHELLTWATLNGAKALRINKQFGSISKGKRPGLVWIQGIDLQRLQLTEQTTARRII
ncbi:chlorohydrolase [Bacteroidia bacterium]|nr:chlorohydrolase [Bacteroidia bacterium]